MKIFILNIIYFIISIFMLVYFIKKEMLAIKNNKHIYESKIANNGQRMTIIEYRSSNDIDIEFEDGTIVKNKSYSAFKNGAIKNPNFHPDRDIIVGQQVMAKNGMMMTVINYCNKGSMDIQFDDGTIIRNVTYKAFKNGTVKYPCCHIVEDSILGQTGISIEGFVIKIIAFRDKYDMDVQFEDGTIVKAQTYGSFKKGLIKHPSLIKRERIGEQNMANNGQKMTIIAYRKSNDIDVQFEDGTIVSKKSYSSFRAGAISNPNVDCNEKCRIGQTNKSKYGLIMTIIAYRNKCDIDVQFEDGVIVTNKTYSNFLKGSIKHSQLKVGTTATAINGQKMTIIAFRNHCDIDVQFEDGTVVEHKKYHSFQKGQIANPNYSRNDLLTERRTGETNTATNGQVMTIVAYRSSNDIDVRFEDGTIVTNKNYYNFQTGKIENPNFNISTKRLGETSTSSQNELMTIIAYRSTRDIDIQFDDGTIAYNCTYNSFKSGHIRNPSINNSRLGEQMCSTCGMMMKIIAYHSANNIDIEFEDGTIVKNKTYGAFKKGAIRKPK